jgi:hypothetical protein
VSVEPPPPTRGEKKLRFFNVLRQSWREIAVVACLLGPFAVPFVLGFLWLAEHNWALVWFGFAAACGLAAALLLRQLRRREAIPSALSPTPADAAWGPGARDAWERVQAAIGRTPVLPFESPDKVRAVLVALVEDVARQYGPESVAPLARFTAPEALLLVERTSRRLRASLLDAVPFSHAVPLSTLMWWYDRRGLIDVATRLYDVYRVFRPLIDPASALFGEMRGRVTQDVVRFGTDRLRRTLTRLLMEEAGRAAIDLYSGRLRIDEAKLEGALAGPDDAAPAAGPTRLLLAGQVNAGKSSLINALAGEVRAAATSVPGPEAAHVVDIALAGRPAVRLVDAPGLKGEPEEAAALAALAANADLILWVCAANNAARAVDAQALAGLRTSLAKDRAADPPPVLLVVPHVDRLPPFAEWAPPYDIVRAADGKARRIREAVAAVCADLGIAEADAVPVCLDARKGLYNVDLVWALIGDRLPAAQTRQLQRAFAAARQGVDLPAVLRQAGRAGRALLGAFR